MKFPQLNLRKRQKFVLSAGVLSILMLGIEVSGFQFRSEAIVVLGMISLVLGIWSLREGLLNKASYLSLILPVSFTVAVGFFYLLLPSNWVTLVPVVILFGIGEYALFLTANIYTVAAVRTIALLRAAQAVGYVLTLLTLFLSYDSILSYRWSPVINALAISLVSFPLYLSGVWSVSASEVIDRRVVLFSFVLSLVSGEIALFLGLWPVTVAVGSLFLTTMGYILLGLSQHELSGRLFKQTVWEYLAVGAAVFITMFLTTRWGG